MSGILGLGSGQAAALNNDLIEKLKVVDTKAFINPIEIKIDKIPLEQKEISDITNKINDLLSTIKNFSLNQSSGINAFDSKEADISGDSVKFDVENIQNIKNGNTIVEVKGLAQKDVWQTNKFTNENNLMNTGVISVSIGNETKEIDTTNMSYQDFSTKLNELGVNSSIEKSGNEYRMVIKSKDTGLENKISFSGELGLLGLNDETNNVLKAKNLELKVDGIEYSNSTNNIVIDGLKITAIKEGNSIIDIKEDKTTLTTLMKEFQTKFNEVNELLEKGIYDKSSNIENKSLLRDISNNLKNTLFRNGNTTDQSIFNIGFSLNEKNGNLIFNEKEFEKAINENKSSIKDLFVGVPEKKGIATELDELISNSGITKQLLDYDLTILTKQDKLNKEKEEALKTIENKYQLMATQFAAYGNIINQMEASFSGFKMLIESNNRKN